MRLILLLLACAAEPRVAPSAGRVEAVAAAVAVSRLDRVEVLTADGPVVVAVHGLGDTPEGFAGLFEGGPPMRLILPRAPMPYGSGGAWMGVRRDDEARYAEEVRAAADELAVLLRELGGKPVITGFSQGGILAFAVAVLHPDTVSAAIPLAGWLPRPLWPTEVPPGAPPIHALHGDADGVLPLGPTREGVEHLRAIGWEAELTVYPGLGHSLNREARAELFRTLGR